MFVLRFVRFFATILNIVWLFLLWENDWNFRFLDYDFFVGLLLYHCLWRWPKIKTTWRFVFDAIITVSSMLKCSTSPKGNICENEHLTLSVRGPSLNTLKSDVSTGNIVLDLELREGSWKFLYKVFSNTKKVLSSTRWEGGGAFLGHTLFWCQWRCSVW